MLIPESQRRIVKDQDLSGQRPYKKALGICWKIGEDAFTFQIKLDGRPWTKRVRLSVISSIYNPLGFAAPFVLEGAKFATNDTNWVKSHCRFLKRNNSNNLFLLKY